MYKRQREEAFTLADRIALMRDGRVLQSGRPEDLYFEPADRWCARFVGASNVVPAAVARSLGRADGPVDGDVLVRPELVTMAADPEGGGEVVERTFLGHDVLYRIRLGDGTTLASQRPSTERVPLGARVSVRLHDGPVTSFPPT